MSELDGLWRVERTGGLLPPLPRVVKEIGGTRGETRLGRLPGVPFDVDGLTLRYRPPLLGLVDVLEPDAHGFRGQAMFLGRRYGTFVLRRIGPITRSTGW